VLQNGLGWAEQCTSVSPCHAPPHLRKFRSQCVAFRRQLARDLFQRCAGLYQRCLKLQDPVSRSTVRRGVLCLEACDFAL